MVESNNKITIKRDNKTVATAVKEGNFYCLHSKQTINNAIFNFEHSTFTFDLNKDIRMAHIALGHASSSRVKKYLEKTLNRKITTYQIREQFKNCDCNEIDIPKKKGSKVKHNRVYSVGFI